jgi:hypothetical protein
VLFSRLIEEIRVFTGMYCFDTKGICSPTYEECYFVCLLQINKIQSLTPNIGVVYRLVHVTEM